MTNTIFDLVDEDFGKGKEGYMKLAGNAPAPKDDSFLSSVGEYAKSALKGGVEGLTRLGHIMGPIQDTYGKPLSRIREEQTEAIDELIPTENPSLGQRGLRRGLAMAPEMAAFPGSGIQALPRSIAAGFLGEGAKDLGAPEWAQTAVELTAFIGPDVTKKLLSAGKSKDIVDAGRRMGLTDEQITPLMQSGTRLKWLSKLAPKRGSTEKALQSTKNALSEGYNTLKESASASSALSEAGKEKMIDSLALTFKNMPAGVRSKMRQDTADLLNSPITGESLINYWQDINHNLGPKSKQLSLLKKPIKEAIQSVSPELAKDFEMLNALQSKYYPVAAKLRPTLTSDIVKAAETLGLIGGVAFGHYPSLLAIAGEKGARKLAQQMLINPRLQQLSSKMVDAINTNKFGVAKKVYDLFTREVLKLDSSYKDKIEDISEEDLMDLFSHLKKAE